MPLFPTSGGVTGSSISGLTPAQLLFGAAGGSFGQSSALQWNGTSLFVGADTQRAVTVTGSVETTGSYFSFHGVLPNILVVSGSTSRVAIGGGVGAPTTELDVYRNVNGGAVRAQIRNQSSGAGSTAGLLVNVSAGTSGDPFIQMQIGGGGGKFTAGLDNSDADAFKFSFDATEDIGVNPCYQLRQNNNFIFGSGSLYSGTEVSNFPCLPSSSGSFSGAVTQVGANTPIAIGIGKNGRPHLFANVGGTWFSASFQNG